MSSVLTKHFEQTTTEYSFLFLIVFLMFACNNFSFRAFVTMIYWTSTKVLLNVLAPLDSAVPSLDFEQINVFWTSSFDSASIVFDLLSVSRSFLELYFSYFVWVFLLLTLIESIYDSWLWFHWHCTVFCHDLLRFRRRFSKSCCTFHLHVSSFDFE